MDYRGVVAAGTPANIERVVKRAATPANSCAAYILAGFRVARPDLDVVSVLHSVPADGACRERQRLTLG